jgi:hypothetical protein
MKTFKNKNFKKRDYETTNIVFCQSENAPNENWIEVDASENKLNHLYTEAGVRYFGWL